MTENQPVNLQKDPSPVWSKNKVDWDDPEDEDICIDKQPKEKAQKRVDRLQHKQPKSHKTAPPKRPQGQAKEKPSNIQRQS